MDKGMAVVGENGMKRLRHVARVVGEGSACAKALAEHKRRTEAGENVVILEGRGMLLVGPDPATTGATDER